MSKLWSFLKGQLSKAEKSKPSPPLVHEAIDVGNFPVENYHKWLDTEKAHSLAQKIKAEYRDYLIEKSHNRGEVDFMADKASNGFVLYASTLHITQEDSDFLSYHFYLGLKEYKYILNTRDKKTRQKGIWLETIDRYYMKPSIRLPQTSSGQVNQLFGNIHIENISRNGNPYMLKLLCSYYNDSQYSDPLPFSDLLDYICNS